MSRPAPIGAGFLARSLDRRMTRPSGIAFWLDDVPPRATTLALAFQHLALQSVYFVIPSVLAGSLSRDPADAQRFLCLSILAAAFWQVLQLARRGPVGSGYPIPGTHSVALVGAYALVGATGGGFGTAGAMLMLTGVACVLLTFVIRRLRVLLPNEVAAVVVLQIGIALVAVATQRLGMQPGGQLPPPSAVISVLACMGLMAVVALSRTRFAPLAVLIGATAGVPIALALGHGVPGAGELLASRPWIALPQPWAPRFDQVEAAPMAAFLVAIVALKGTALGSLVSLQRGADAEWSRPDAPPIRRGLLAHGLAMVSAGLMGAASPGPGTAALGLSIATGTLARRIVWVGAALLTVVALSPKLAMLFVLIPEPVKAAMLFYVSGFVMAQGCQLVTARLLDARRTMVVAFGLCAGVSVVAAPQAYATALPALTSPIALGAMTAFLVNLVTLPLVSRRASLSLAIDAHAQRAVTDWFAGVAGSWALKPQTGSTVSHALLELTELLTARGLSSLTLDARLAEDRVELTLSWPGAPLPDPPASASPEDLIGTDEAREAFGVWLATRRAQGFRQRTANGTSEAWLVF